MRRGLGAIALAVLALGLAGPAAARKLDRRSALHLALVQNPQIAAARAEEDVLRALQRQAKALRMPTVVLNAGVGPALQATLVPGTAAQSVERQYQDLKWSDATAVMIANLSVIQPIYTFGKIAKRNEAADHGLRAREAQTRMRRADVAFEVAQLYEGLLFARDAGRFYDEMKSWLEKMLETSEDLIARKVKTASERDILRIQAAMGMADLGIHQTRAGEAAARAGLVAYLSLGADETVEPAEDEQTPVGHLPGGYAELLRLARDNRPEFTALREGERALGALARAEAAGLWPNVLAMGLIDAAYTPGRDWLETRYVIDPLNHIIPALFVGLRWELQGTMAPARAAEQRARANVILHLGEWANDGVPAEVRRYYEEAESARKDIESASEAVKKAKQWMIESSTDYGIGLLDAREVSDAVSSYVNLRTALFRARYDHNVAMAALSRAVGNLDRSADIYLGWPGEEGKP